MIKWIKDKIIWFFIGSIAIGATLTYTPCLEDTAKSINAKIQTCSALQTSAKQAEFKSLEIAKLNHKGIYDSIQYGVRVEIIGDVKAIEVNGQHGVEVFAKAWKGGKQLGFGKDGSVEIERFRIFNPPILVNDPQGTIILDWFDEGIKTTKQRRLREDPAEATRQTLAHTIAVTGRVDTSIVPNSVGNTTSTFFSDLADAGPSLPNQVSFANARNATSVNDDGTSTIDFFGAAERETTGSDYNVARGFFPFDTSTIPDADPISSATVTFTKAGGENPQTAGITVGTLATPPTYVAGDFDGITLNSPAEGTTARVDTNVANDATFVFTLNATGIGFISKTSWTVFVTRYTGDIDNVTPPNSTRRYTQTYYANRAGTTQDPKLVVVHGAAESAVEVNSSQIMIIGI